MVVLGSLVAAATLSLGLWLRWLYSPDALVRAGGYTLTMNRGPVVTVYSPGMVEPSADNPIALNVRSVTPHIVHNTAGATITALICHRNGSITRLGSDDLSMCAWTKPFEPGVLTLNSDLPGSDSIIFKVTSQHPGRVTIDGVQVRYRQGLRHGNQDTGPTFVLRSRQGSR